MGGEVGKASSSALLPLLPSGERLFSNLPARAIVLAELAPALGDGVITLVNGESTAVLVVRGGGFADVVSIMSGARETGEAAMAVLRRWDSASVSCTRLTVEAMSLLGPLLHGELVYSDLRLEWTAWATLLADLRVRGQTFVVELQTPNERGVTVIRDGEQIATFTDSHLELCGSDVLDRLAAAGTGSITVSAHATLVDTVSPPPVALASPVASAAHVAGPPSALDAATTEAADVSDDDANATLSTLFGLAGVTHSFAPTLVTDRADRAAGDVWSLLPELKLLAQRRLQRSSAPVVDAVDRAAAENRSIDWLVARVRVMRVRGFVPETFEQLADEMEGLKQKT
jgi:hypothetical protein